ncbi:DUF4232 domain-containing protein [Streptomyces sp. NPDC003077]|uniref:DUF4232 domain-containing protein n=1 Tax=Streptomyces sp. NPDC003077 TaxID=3154443 RepID=UPI0033A5E62C
MYAFRHRTRAVRLAASGAVVAAALSLTACQGGDAKAQPAPTSSASASQGGQHTTGNQPASQNTHTAPAETAPASTTTKAGDTGKHATQAPASRAQDVACTSKNTKVTVQKISRPINHLLLTVTNTGSTRCDAYAYPYLRFDENQAVTPVVEASRPQAVVSLKPGQSAYAGIRTSSASGEGGKVRPAYKLAVLFADRNGQGGSGSPVVLTLPKDTQIDDSAEVTYWQSTLDDAISW